MNKAELIEAIATKSNVSKKVVDQILVATLDTIVEAVTEGDKVVLIGFGSFEARERQAREGRNPRSGEKLTIAATKVPVFTAGKQFKEEVASDRTDTK